MNSAISSCSDLDSTFFFDAAFFLARGFGAEAGSSLLERVVLPLFRLDDRLFVRLLRLLQGLLVLLLGQIHLVLAIHRVLRGLVRLGLVQGERFFGVLA